MTDRPIIFSAPMVRALLEGRKTQTRRILKLPHDNHLGVWEATTVGGRGATFRDGSPAPEMPAVWHTRTGDCIVPRFAVGDRLWVRENWRTSSSDDFYLESLGRVPSPADLDPKSTAVEYLADNTHELGGKNRPSIHMPCWASRLTLIVTGVKVERLQDISRADAEAEGIEYETADPPFWYVPGIWPHSLTAVGIEEPGGRHAERSFAKLWDHVNGAGAWDANPWVAAVTFIVHKGNIESLEGR